MLFLISVKKTHRNSEAGVFLLIQADTNINLQGFKKKNDSYIASTVFFVRWTIAMDNCYIEYTCGISNRLNSCATILNLRAAKSAWSYCSVFSVAPYQQFWTMSRGLHRSWWGGGVWCAPRALGCGRFLWVQLSSSVKCWFYVLRPKFTPPQKSKQCVFMELTPI